MSYKVLDIPKEERPRERMLNVGCSNLSNQELLSIILKSGTKEKNVKEIALDLLTMTNFEDLKDITINKLITIKGIGKVKAMELVASIELGKRIFLGQKEVVGKRMQKAEVIYEDSKYLFQGKKQEYFYCLYFNNKQELIERKLLFMGTINRSTVHPREVFKEAYLLSASAIICMHNHPSGSVDPSKEDISFTSSLIEIGKLQGIPVVDHIIIGDNKYYSFYEASDIL